MRTNPANLGRSRSLPLFAILVASAAFGLAGAVFAQTEPPDAGVTPSAEATPQYLRVNANQVNLRTRADINSRIVDRVDRDTVLKVAGREYEWYRVQPTPNSFSLVSARYIKRSTGDHGTVQVDTTLRVRVGSDVQPRDPLLSEVQTLLETGDDVRIIGALDDEWMKIAPPEGVGFYVHQDFVEPIAAAEAQRLMAQAPVRTTGPAPHVEAPEPAPVTAETAASTTAEAATETESRWNQRMNDVLATIEAEEQKPDAEQDWNSFLSPLKRLAAQKEDAATAGLASAWVTRLEQRITARQPKERPEALAVTPPPAQPTPELAEHPKVTTGFDASGILRPSFAVPVGPYGLRYKLEHATSKKVTAYVEFPTALGVDAGALVGKYVGIRGKALRDKETGIEVIRVEKLTVLGGAPAEIPARPTP